MCRRWSRYEGMQICYTKSRTRCSIRGLQGLRAAGLGTHGSLCQGDGARQGLSCGLRPALETPLPQPGCFHGCIGDTTNEEIFLHSLTDCTKGWASLAEVLFTWGPLSRLGPRPWQLFALTEDSNPRTL